MSIKERIGKKLRWIRNAKKLTQEELAQLFSTTKYSISKYESGDREPDSEFLEAFIKHFAVNANWIFYDSPPIFLETTSKKQEVNALFFELLAQLSEYQVQPLQLSDTVVTSLEALGENSPQNYLNLLSYMQKDPELRQQMFQLFYLFLKPISDKNEATTSDTEE